MKFVESPPRALVIGASATSDLLHLPVLAKLQSEGSIELRVICDLDHLRANEARRKHGFREASGDAAAALIRTDIDVAYVFGSAQLHLNLGRAALENGKHLFVEKPVAPTAADARELANLAKASGLIAAGGHNRRFYKSLNEVRARIGRSRPRYVEAVFHKPEFAKSPPFGARTWLSANGIHALDAMLYMMEGPPESMTSLRHGESFSVLMRWSDGAQGTFLCNNEAGERREWYAFHLPGLTCTVDDKGLRLSAGGKVEKLGPAPKGDGFEDEHRAFVEAVSSGIEPRHSIGLLVPSLAIAERIEEGFSGNLSPVMQRLRPRAAPPPVRALVVDRAVSLGTALSRLAGKYDLVSVEEITGSSNPRPDVVGAILGSGSRPLSHADLEKLPNLQVIGVAALSLARYEAPALLARGISVVNATEAYADSVAEFAMALMVLGRRRAFQSHELMRNGGWGNRKSGTPAKAYARTIGLPIAKVLRVEEPLRALWRRAVDNGKGGVAPNARLLRGATVGLIGWGANGRALRQMLENVGADVRVYTEHASNDELPRTLRASLSEVLSADIVSLHRGLTPSTRHFLGATELAQLRPASVLINVARGELIDPDALLERLRAGDIFACLDTYEVEPLPPKDALRRLPNVFLTSHIAGGSDDMHKEAALEVVSKVVRFLDGETNVAVSQRRLVTMT
jgi:phosphoglycerate dehydrogenase-like enzyme/predicted dehydrogenase